MTSSPSSAWGRTGAKLCFAACLRAGREAELPHRRPQAELGNEKNPRFCPMPDFLKSHYGPAEGPLGFPMPDAAAKALDALLTSLPRTPEHEYRHLFTTKAPTE